MPRPWSESTTLLAAAGLGTSGPLPPSPSIWSRLMSQHIDYAFLTRIDGHARPIAFTGIAGLARHIETQRRGQGILLEEIDDIHARRRMATGTGPAFAPPGRRDRGVQIHTLLLDGGRDRSLGFAWLNGGGREALQQALCQAALAKGSTTRLARAA